MEFENLLYQGIQEINWEQSVEEDVDVAGVAVWEYRV